VSREPASHTLILVTLVIVVAIGGLVAWVITRSTAEYHPAIRPTNFSSAVTNPYFSLPPGKKLTYEGPVKNGVERDEFIVLNEKKSIMGVDCVTVRDTVWTNNQLTEQTLDWYAQAKNGDVWYFGEDTKEYESGKVTSTAGTWEAGKNGAQPGILMKAAPQVGDTWRQEYLKGVAEDKAQVLGTHETVSVPTDTYQNCVKTKDWTDLEPNKVENKYYCAGNVALTTTPDGSERVQLTSISP